MNWQGIGLFHEDGRRIRPRRQTVQSDDPARVWSWYQRKDRALLMDRVRDYFVEHLKP